jgi:peptidoglycan/LPS O-acetylase OafA/YrhL
MSDSQQAHHDYINRRYFPSMDGLRCIAILAVICYHCGITSVGATGFRRYVSAGIFGYRGPLGVSFFFVISGFLITTLILRERDKFGFISLRNFYARRTLRIFPLYYAVLAFNIFFVIFFEHPSPAKTQFFHNIPSFLTYTANWFVNETSDRRIIFSVAWSLSTEEQFYLFWPSVVSFSRRWRWFPIVLAIVLGTLNIVLVTLVDARKLTLGMPLENILLLTAPSGVCFGCLLAYALNNQQMFMRLHALLSPRWMIFVALGGTIGLTYFRHVPNAAILPFMLLSLGTTVVQPDHYLKPLLEATPIKFIGAISYGIYLIHVLVLNLGRRVLHIESAVVLVLFTLPTVSLIAWLSYRYWEAPFLRYKDRFAKGPRTAEPVITPPTKLEQAAVAATHFSEDAQNDPATLPT